MAEFEQLQPPGRRERERHAHVLDGKDLKPKTSFDGWWPVKVTKTVIFLTMGFAWAIGGLLVCACAVGYALHAAITSMPPYIEYATSHLSKE